MTHSNLQIESELCIINIISVFCILNTVITPSASLNTNLHRNYTGFNCALDILNSAFDVSVLVAHVDDKNIDELLKRLQVQYFIFNVHTININPVNLYSYLHKDDITLLIIQNVDELQVILEKLTFNVRARCLVLNVGRDDSERLFEIVWAKYIINVDVLSILNDGTTYIHTFFPYENERCGDNITVSNLGQCHDLTLNELFPNKVPLDLHGCEIKVVANTGEPYVIDANLTSENARQIGTEAVVLRNVLGKMNLTQNLITTTYLSFSYRYPNGTIIGTHQYLSNGECDLVYGQKWNTKTFSEVFDSTYTHYSDSFTWHVPAALPGPQWTHIFLTFELGLWTCLLILVPSMMLVVWTIARLCGEETYYSSFSRSSLNMFCILLLGSTRLPRNIHVRIVIYVWSICALIMATSYQSQLLSFLMKPIYEEQISTVDDLVNSHLDILLGPNTVQSLQQSHLPNDLAILKKGYLHSSKDISLKPTRNVSFMAGVCRTKYVMRKLYTAADGQPTIYMFKQVFSTVSLVMNTVKGYPLLDRMNDIILRSMAAGFHAKWMNDIEELKSMKQSELRPLRTGDFTGAYIILALGYVCAILAFVVEVKMSVNNNT